jgi:ankyrin repeat protein
MRCLIAAVFALSLTLPLSAAGAASPVADAVMKGDRAALQSLLAQKTDVNAPQADGATAIQWAAYRGDLEAASLLIAAGANVKTPNRDGATALYLASLRGDAAMIEKLLNAGADPNERGPEGETPLMLAARSGNVDAIQALLAKRVDVNQKDKLRGTTALMWAVTENHPAVVKLLVSHGADLSAATDVDTRNSRNNLANTVTQRLNSPFGTRAQRARAQRAAPAAASGQKPVAERTPEEDFEAYFRGPQKTDGGGLTALAYAAREDSIECARMLVEAGADVNQRTHYGWTPLLVATQNRHYKLAAYLLEHGADPNVANNGGWSPLYLAVDNRNIETGDYPVRAPDMDHLDYIKLLIDKGANVNARVCGLESTAEKCTGDSTETRNNFTMQWLFEDGATPFLRAAQSGDITLMKLLLAHGANPKIFTAHNVTPLAVASGIGWTEGVTFEWSEAENLEAVKMCLDLGVDPNVADDEGRTSLHGAAHKGRTTVIQLLVDHGAKLDVHDIGSRDSINGLLGKTWIPLDWARGLVRVGVQSAIAHTEAEKLLVKLMTDRGIPIPPPPGTTVCLTPGPNGCQ